MVKKISIESEDEQEDLEKAVKEMELDDPQDRSVRKFFDDIREGRLSESWKDLEKVVSEIFNSQIMATIYLYLVRFPEKTVDEITERLEYTREQVTEHLSKLLLRGYIKEKLGEASELEDRLATYAAAPPEEVARKVVRSVEKRIAALTSIDPILLKKAKRFSRLPIRIVVGAGDDGSREDE